MRLLSLNHRQIYSNLASILGSTWDGTQIDFFSQQGLNRASHLSQEHCLENIDCEKLKIYLIYKLINRDEMTDAIISSDDDVIKDIKLNYFLKYIKIWIIFFFFGKENEQGDANVTNIQQKSLFMWMTYTYVHSFDNFSLQSKLTSFDQMILLQVKY